MSLPAVQVTQSPVEKFREYLASRPTPQRFTGQQKDLVEHVFARHSHFDADQLAKDLEEAGFTVSRATVYRTLTKLVDAGMLRKLEIGSKTFYEHDYGYPQHEHLVCEKCGKMIEFQHPAIEAAVGEICGQHHFQAAGHTLVIRGTCVDCNRARATLRRLDLI
ncbi:MAG TPA: Fur family transcriptional regulator [Gemmataceae bacterium]|nr:Fur family transcriptional regulator [Gemmataceae bacterium]